MTEVTCLRLAPVPKRLTRREGVFRMPGQAYTYLYAEDPGLLLPAARKTGLGWPVTASPKGPKDQIGLVIRLDEAAGISAQGYKLAVGPKRIEIESSTPVGAFYGACTLAQILRQSEDAIPCLAISDWPDLPARGVMLDISRDKVPTMETLYHLVDLLSDWKINQLQLYTEHTFAYLAHPMVWEKASPITGEEIMALDEYCRSHFVELVPNQNSFGHMERWLKHDRYRPLAEAPNGCDTEWGHMSHPFSLCATDRRSIRFLAGLYDELLPHFSSRLFNVGCDETIDLGRGRSRKACEERGTGRVYLDFLLDIYRLVTDRGRRMQFWGDIITGYPELIPELPKDMIALEWGYKFDHPFAERCARFSEAQVPFYVCPGASGWNSIVGRAENAVGNIANAAKNGLAQGTAGLLVTEWGDNGHWQPLSVGYLGLMVGAMASWNVKADLTRGLAENLSLHAFQDLTGKTGQAFYDLGNLYLAFAKRTGNSSVPWQMLFSPIDDTAVVDGVRLSEFGDMERRLREIRAAVRGEKTTAPDADIVRAELAHVIATCQLSALIGKMKLGTPAPEDLPQRINEVKRSHEEAWLLRNRPGGLSDSVARMKAG